MKFSKEFLDAYEKALAICLPKPKKKPKKKVKK